MRKALDLNALINRFIDLVVWVVKWLWSELLRRRDLRMSIVRIMKEGGADAGAGLLVPDGRVLTCAPVIAEALGVTNATDKVPKDPVHLDFPFHHKVTGEDSPPCTAYVEHWPPPAGPDITSPDIAILQLTDNPPEAARPALLKGAKDERKVRALRTFPSSGYDNGTWAEGTLRVQRADSGPRIEEVQNRGSQGALCGGPVVEDRKLGRDHIVGSVVGIIDKSTENRESLVIPTEELVEPWPKLKPTAVRNNVGLCGIIVA